MEATSAPCADPVRAARATRSAWRARTPFLIATVGIAACGAAQRPLPRGEQRVAEIAVRGSISVSKGELVSGLALERARKDGDPFDRRLLATDLERLRSWYLRHGWFHAQVHGDVEPRGPDAVRVVFDVDEGPRARLAAVIVTGLPDELADRRGEIRRTIPLADGAPFDYDAFDGAKPAFEAVLARHGYPKGQVAAEVDADPASDTATIRITYRPGPRCVFGPITIAGTSGPLADAVRARLAMHEGAPYSTDRIADTRAQLYQLRRFQSVRIEPELTGDGAVVPVAIAVEASTTHELRLGGGVGADPTAYQVRGRASYAIEGRPCALCTTRASLVPAYVQLRATGAREPRVEALLALERVDLFRPLVTGTVEVGAQWLTVEAYTSEGPHVQLGVKAPLYRRYLQASVLWRLEDLGFRDLSPALPPQLVHELGLDAHDYHLGYFEETVVADLRDDPIEPRRGAYAELRVREGTAVAGGQFDYVRAVPDARGYWPVGPVVVAARARLGAIAGDLPVTERFFGGGANDMRGFGERALSPFVRGIVHGSVVDVPYGGGALLELSLEGRFRVGTVWGLGVGGVVFLDGGDTTERLDELDPAHLHWAPGVGVRVRTVIGAVRADAAYRIDRDEPGEPAAGSRFAVHVSVGEAF